MILSDLPENKQIEIINILNKFNLNDSNDLTSYAPEIQYQLHLLDAATNILSIITNWNVYTEIYQTIMSYFNNLNNHHQHKQIKNLYKNNLDTVFYIHLWANALFYSLVNAQSLADLKQEAIDTKKILHHVINIGAELLFIQNSLLTTVDSLDFKLTRNLFKKYLFIILNEINSKNYNWLKIEVEKKTDVIPLHEFLKNTLETKIKPSENKITVIKFKLLFARNFLRKFNISLKAPTIFKYEDQYYTYNVFKLTSKPLIKQANTKKQTTVNDSFIKAAQHLNNTKFIINKTLLKKITELVEIELENLLKNNQTIIEDAETLHDLKLLLQNLLKRVYTKKYTRSFFQEKLKLTLKEELTQETVSDALKNSKTTQTLSKSLFKTNKDEKNLFMLANSVQVLFAKIYTLTNFLAFVEYIEEYNLTFLYFTVYADFRGRLYYNSEATIQSIWCFRYLYTFETTLVPHLNLYPFSSTQENFWNTQFTKVFPAYKGPRAVIEFFQAIGVIFKTKLTKQDGSLCIADCLNYGFNYYLNFSEFTEDYQNLELKTKAELIYYTTALKDILNYNSELNYYIWKDSTASMAQHGGKILGYKNSTLKYLNLANNFYAYDTYTVIINDIHKFIKKNYNGADEVLPYLQRTVLKQLIMTSEYGVTYYTARKRYFTLVEELTKNNSGFEILTNQTLLKLIYDYLQTDAIGALFYKTTQDSWWTATSAKNISKVEFKDLNYEHPYYKLKTHTLYYDKQNTETRSRTTLTLYLNIWELPEEEWELDVKKTNTAAYVNYVHAWDAYYLRNIARECLNHTVPLATIHDGFAVPYIYVNWLIQVANYSFWDEHTRLYSHTILL